MVRISTGVIPAAGEGKRLGYLSSIIPKCLFPLYDKPIIHYVIENMVRIGIDRIIIPIHYQKNKLIEYFEYARKDIDADICLLELNELPNGIALTLASAKESLDEPFMVILGDDITVTDSLQDLVDLFFRTDAIAVEGVVQEENQDVIRRTCCVRLKRNKQILEIVEKPSNPVSNIRGCGVYVFDPTIFEYIMKTPVLPPRQEVEITNTLGLVAKCEKAYGDFIKGINVNINTPDDMFRAWAEMKDKVARMNNGQF
jgi:dTDP-glucose pyrophosphorylase